MISNTKSLHLAFIRCTVQQSLDKNLWHCRQDTSPTGESLLWANPAGRHLPEIIGTCRHSNSKALSVIAVIVACFTSLQPGVLEKNRHEIQGSSKERNQVAELYFISCFLPSGASSSLSCRSLKLLWRPGSHMVFPQFNSNIFWFKETDARICANTKREH